MGYYMIYVKCEQSRIDCFACKNGKCVILSDTTFKNAYGLTKPCPFYKKLKEKNDSED